MLTAPGFCLGCKSRRTVNKPVQKQGRLWNVLDLPLLLGRRRTFQLRKKSGPDGRPPAGGSHQLPANPFHPHSPESSQRGPGSGGCSCKAMGIGCREC